MSKEFEDAWDEIKGYGSYRDCAKEGWNAALQEALNKVSEISLGEEWGFQLAIHRAVEAIQALKVNGGE